MAIPIIAIAGRAIGGLVLKGGKIAGKAVKGTAKGIAKGMKKRKAKKVNPKKSTKTVKSNNKTKNKELLNDMATIEDIENFFGTTKDPEVSETDKTDKTDKTEQKNEECYDPCEEKSSYKKKEEKQQKLKEKQQNKNEKEHNKKTVNLLGNIKDKLKTIAGKTYDTGSNIISYGVEKAKKVGSKIKEKGSSLFTKMMIAAVMAIIAFWDTASKHKNGVIGWVAEKVWNILSATSGVLWDWMKETAWPAIKEFFTGKNFIYKMFWGEDETGNTSGVLFEIKKYFKSGKALEHLIKTADFINNIIDEVFTFLFGDWWTGTKDWVRNTLHSILDWWDDVEQKGGIIDWIYYNIYQYLKDVPGIGRLLPEPKYVKEEQKIIEKEVDKINKFIYKDNEKKKKPLFDYLVKKYMKEGKTKKEAKLLAIIQINNKDFQKALDLNLTKSLSFEDYKSIKNSNEINSNYKDYYKYLAIYNNKYKKELSQDELTQTAVMIKSILNNKNNISTSNNSSNNFLSDYLQNTSNNTNTVNTIKNISGIQTSTNNFGQSQYSSQNEVINNTTDIMITSNTNKKSITVKTKDNKDVEIKDLKPEINRLAQGLQMLNNKIDAKDNDAVTKGFLGTIHQFE